ncbi:hypothetical protein A9R05_32960 (plasmid) [Burkholderia sp. KK1]|nr:hypothetical protein A9R05_32960 [Burkholderia sp. KK1]
MSDSNIDEEQDDEPRWVSVLDHWERNIPLAVFVLLCLFVIASSASVIFSAVHRRDGESWQGVLTIVPFVVFIALTLAFSAWFIACFTGAPTDEKRRQSFRFAYAFTITSFVVLMIPVANPWQPEILGPVSLIRGCVVPDSPNDNSVPRAVSCVQGEEAYFPKKTGAANDVHDTGAQTAVVTPGAAKDISAYPWLVTIGGFNGLVVDTKPSGGRARYNVVRGGFVVPFYVVLLALVGAAVSLTRRIPEYQKRSERTFIATSDVSALTLLETREVVVFQIMQLISAGFIAIVAFYALAPNSMSTAIALAFMSGFSSELILLQIRSIVEGLQPKTTKPVSAGIADAKGSIEGTVTDASGQPVSDARVTIDGHEGFKALTDAAGRYLLSGVQPGEYTVTATVSDATRRVKVTVGTGERATVNIRL